MDQLTTITTPRPRVRAEFVQRKLFSVVAMIMVFTLGVSSAGCGTTKSYSATEQLLMSDAVDTTVAKLDFTPLAGHRVYLDGTYLKTQRTPQLIDADYVMSSLRQQMVSAGVLLVDGREEADIIAEARMGALGLDGHNVTYGIPASNLLSSASSVIANAPPIPTIPELSLARREAKTGAAKLAVFAYDRQTREPYWQSGIARSSSAARDTWLFGIGPWQRGTIYDGTRFAGTRIKSAILGINSIPTHSIALDEYRSPKIFAAAAKDSPPADVESRGTETQLAGAEDSESEDSLTVVPAGG